MTPIYPVQASDFSGCLSLALAATDAAQAQLNRYAQATDQPAWDVVAAADCLDTAIKHLATAMTGGSHG